MPIARGIMSDLEWGRHEIKISRERTDDQAVYIIIRNDTGSTAILLPLSSVPLRTLLGRFRGKDD